MNGARHLHFKSVTYSGQAAGVRLIVTGAVHGNETCGSVAIARVMAEIDSGVVRLSAGSVTFVPVANPLAYEQGQRAGQRNLNRKLFPSAQPREFEDHVANWLCPLLGAHDVLLDLHSFGAPGQPFVLVGPRDNAGPLEPFAQSAPERALARRLGVRRFVDGWLAAYGTGVARRMADSTPEQRAEQLRYGVGTTEYMRSQGGYALTLECGQHRDPAAPEVAYQAILRALAFLGLCDTPAPAPIEAAQIEALTLVAVHDRQSAQDQFTRPWVSFDAVSRGQAIGLRADGSALVAEHDARILFPDAQAGVGHEWFYLACANPNFEYSRP